MTPEWWCQCSCEAKTERYVRAKNLIKGMSQSCGCLGREATQKRRTHGHSRTPTYTAWLHMRRRCAPNGHPDYAGRGITVCAGWQASFASFLESMGPRPNGHDKTLDRVDNSLGYWCGQCVECTALGRKLNCRWASWMTQARNTRHNRRISIGGVTKCVSEWAETMGLPRETIYRRLSSGWSDEAAVTTPHRSRRPDRVSAGIGVQNTNAVFSPAQVLVIIQRLLRGDRQKLIADDYGVTRTAVNCIRRGITWKHVAPEIPRPITPQPQGVPARAP